MIRASLLVLCGLALAARAVAQDAASLDELLPRTPPKEPAEALETFETQAGFEMQLVAAEPLVTDPVAAAFDENGLLYVAEMIDYPYPPREGAEPLGRVHVLEDADGDGVFERSDLFAEKLLWPTGVVPWRGGVFVAAAPDIWYLKDTDGDRRADVRERVYSGFGTQNEQGTVNNLAWGLDNRIYGSASTNGGKIAATDDGKQVALDGQDFRFDPASRTFEAITGRGQFGCAFDDWGNRFVCTESKPLYHVVLPRQYLARNPLLAVAGVLEDLAPGVTTVFRTSPIEPWRAIRSARRLKMGERGAESAGASHEVIDAAAGLTIYRGHAYPAEYQGNFFVGCSQTNLIHRRIVEPAGVTFTSRRADEGTEFVRSSDTWFRPVNMIHAPDGTLFVLDMSREVIEAIHIPLDVVAKLDLTSGRDRGRIYRLAPPGFKVPPPPRLSAATTEELVATLEHPGGWWRDTAARLLYERHDRAAIEPLRRLLSAGTTPQARVHALWALEGLRGMTNKAALVALGDEEAPVREHAIRVAELCLERFQAARQTHFLNVGEVQARIRNLAHDPDPRVRMQVAFSAPLVGAKAETVEALVAVARRDAGDRWTQAAIASSLANLAAPFLMALLADTQGLPEGAESLAADAAFVVGARSSENEVSGVLDKLAGSTTLDSNANALADAVLLGLARGLRQSGKRLSELELPAESSGRAYLAARFGRAREVLTDASAPTAARMAAMRFVNAVHRDDVLASLIDLVPPGPPEELRQAAIEGLAGASAPIVHAALMGELHRGAPPALQQSILASLTSHPAGVDVLLRSIERGELPASICAPTTRAALENHSDAALAKRAKALFAAGEAARAGVIDDYRAVAADQGDAARGRAVYERECQACHRLGEQGHQVGPNLALTRNRTPEALLVAILDPNRDVQPQYVQYVVVDTSGRTAAGIVTSDTPASITLAREQGRTETILKSDIEEFSSTGRSIMPEGFEKTIDQRAMADLIAFLLAEQYDVGTEPGHLPAPAQPGDTEAKADSCEPFATAEDEVLAAIAAAMAAPLLAPCQPLAEARAFLEPRVAAMPQLSNAAAWTEYAAALRRRVLDEVVFRGAARQWRDAPGQAIWFETQDIDAACTLTRLRFEVLPGMWVPALLYAPKSVAGRVPAVLNLNGHEPEGMTLPFKQLRCLNLAHRGMLALNVEWFGMGQLRAPGFMHDRLNQIDLCGTSGFAPFYLAMTRALDLLAADPRVDAGRIAVTGLSGGGLQTAFLMGLDERVAVAVPVAGFCSQRTALRSNDLGDSEHVPSDLAALADFTHLAAMRAPRHTLVIYNAGDECCFRPAQVLPPILAAARPVYELLGAADRLRSHVNMVPGTHNYERDNREALYAILAEAFGLNGAAADSRDLPLSTLPTGDPTLIVPMPSENRDFNRLAAELAKDLPRVPTPPPLEAALDAWRQERRLRLAELVRAPHYKAGVELELPGRAGPFATVLRRFALGTDWTVPAIELIPPGAKPERTVLVIADSGRANQPALVRELLEKNCRVVALDPFLWGESRITGSDDSNMFALHAMGVGERPLGIQAAQINAVIRLLIAEEKTPVTIHVVGPRASLAALVAAAIEPEGASGVELAGALESLKELISENRSANDLPEMFAFGLLAEFDVATLVALIAPRPVTFHRANP